jgi:hypothetical protein
MIPTRTPTTISTSEQAGREGGALGRAHDGMVPAACALDCLLPLMHWLT